MGYTDFTISVWLHMSMNKSAPEPLKCYGTDHHLNSSDRDLESERVNLFQLLSQTSLIRNSETL